MLSYINQESAKTKIKPTTEASAVMLRLISKCDI